MIHTFALEIRARKIAYAYGMGFLWVPMEEGS